MTVETNVAIDRTAFRKALGQFPTGVCVVTCMVDGEPLGMTMSSFNSLSLDPPLVLFSIDRSAASMPLWLKAESYAINVLSENQEAIASRFAKRHSKKWAGLRFAIAQLKAPALPGVAALFECVPWANHECGDHILFIAEVRSFSSSVDRMPLVFSKGRYAVLQSVEFDAQIWSLDLNY